VSEPKAPRRYRVVHNAVDGFVAGDVITAADVADIARLRELGAIEILPREE
jgi:hypothetical protein